LQATQSDKIDSLPKPGLACLIAFAAPAFGIKAKHLGATFTHYKRKG
jgi:hypothetical protein